MPTCVGMTWEDIRLSPWMPTCLGMMREENSQNTTKATNTILYKTKHLRTTPLSRDKKMIFFSKRDTLFSSSILLLLKG